jgi:hypothetical protein
MGSKGLLTGCSADSRHDFKRYGILAVSILPHVRWEDENVKNTMK